jgi:hypothetical protein
VKSLGADTFAIAPKTGTNGYTCFCKVTDDDGNSTIKTIPIVVNLNPPIAIASSPNEYVSFNDTIHLIGSKSTDNKQIVKWEWDIGNTGKFVQTSTSDTTIVGPGTVDTAFKCVLRVTDGDGNVGVSVPLKIYTSRFGKAVDTSAFDQIANHSSLAYDNKLWIIGGNTFSTLTDCNSVWNTKDGSNWILITPTAEFSKRSKHASVIFNNKMWVIGGGSSFFGTQKYTSFNDIWYSTDGVTWTNATHNAAFPPRSGHSIIVFNNKMWIIGGYNDTTDLNDIWSSTDGVNWIEVTEHAQFSPRSEHASIVFDNKIWVIAGCNKNNNGSYTYKNDIWSSSDGISWETVTLSANFNARANHASIASDSTIWIIGGETNANYPYLKDVWSSVDGILWKNETPSINDSFPYRSFHSVTKFNDKIWIIGGYGASKSEVWYMNCQK